ncbi:MAG: hypothetical protein QM820_33230 [Minicystis sp.]
MYDFFVAPLRCPACGAESPAGARTNMQTRLRDDADGSALTVGTRLSPGDVDPDNILDAAYQSIRRPAPGEPIRLLETWHCPACGRSDNWAVVEIDDGVIEKIEAVKLDRATLESAHFISDQCEILAAQISDVPARDLATGKVSCVDVLRARLP